jgi:hypothetical protein
MAQYEHDLKENPIPFVLMGWALLGGTAAVLGAGAYSARQARIRGEKEGWASGGMCLDHAGDGEVVTCEELFNRNVKRGLQTGTWDESKEKYSMMELMNTGVFVDPDNPAHLPGAAQIYEKYGLTGEGGVLDRFGEEVEDLPSNQPPPQPEMDWKKIAMVGGALFVGYLLVRPKADEDTE